MNSVEAFNQQINTCIQKGYPAIAGITPRDFLKLLQPLEKQIYNLTIPEIDLEQGRLPFVIVIKSDLVPTNKAISAINKDGKVGITKLFPLEPKDFTLINEVAVPENHAYLMIDIDRGKDTINLPPKTALQRIQQAGRSPITLDEGIAIVTQFPDFLIKNNCFSMLASRHTGDQRVPAIWINGNKNPNLGWCWNGNPHTWLGSASCKARIGN